MCALPGPGNAPLVAPLRTPHRLGVALYPQMVYPSVGTQHSRNWKGITQMRGKLKLVADHAAADGWSYDPWGTAINLHFDICEVLDADSTDEGAAALAQWEYSRGAVARQSLESIAFMEGEAGWGAASLAQALRNGEVTQADLIYAGNVLDRYTNLLRAAGKDY